MTHKLKNPSNFWPSPILCPRAPEHEIVPFIMFLWIFSAAKPAKLILALSASDMVAPLIFLNFGMTFWTFFNLSFFHIFFKFVIQGNLTVQILMPWVPAQKTRVFFTETTKKLRIWFLTDHVAMTAGGHAPAEVGVLVQFSDLVKSYEFSKETLVLVGGQNLCNELFGEFFIAFGWTFYI